MRKLIENITIIWLTIPTTVKKMMTANAKNAMKAFAWTLGCRF